MTWWDFEEALNKNAPKLLNHTPQKTNEWLAGKSTMNEDVFHIENLVIFQPVIR